MKGKVMIPMMIGLFCLFFLSSIVEAGGLPECQNNLNTCTTNLAVCTANLTNAQDNYEVCTESLTTEQSNMAIAQENLATAQANLATCQATLAELNQKKFPSWDKKLVCDSPSNCPRFEVLEDWDNAAVLDKETGLVWERSLSTETFTWYDAQWHCNNLYLGNRKGWRLPTIQELSSLVDKTTYAPSLPSGHPFQNMGSGHVFWSATTVASDTSFPWHVTFDFGDVMPGFGFDKSYWLHLWCVRGGQGVDPQ